MSFRARAALLLLAAALCVSPSAPARNSAQQSTPATQATHANPPSAGLVTLRITVVAGRDGEQFVGGLTRDSFGVFERKEAREIARFGEDDGPASVAVVVDNSGSFGRAYEDGRLGILREGVARLAYHGPPGSEFFVVTFNTRQKEFSDWTRDPNVMAAAVGATPARGQTPLFDTCAEAIERLARGRHAKRALVLVSDGHDNASRRGEKDLRRLLRSHGVLFYVISPGLLTDDHPSAYNARRNFEEWAKETGGRAMYPRYGREVVAAFDRVAATLRSQYTLAFVPSAAPSPEEKWHEVKVKVQPPAESVRGLKDVRVLAPSGYLTPARNP